MRAVAITYMTVVLGCASTAWSQVAPRVIVGQVVDSASGRPLASAYVQLDSTTDGGVSDSTGTFRFASRYAARFRTLRVRKIGHRARLVVMSNPATTDSIVVGRIGLTPEPNSLWVDRMPECRELKTEVPPLRKDTIFEWIRETKDKDGRITRSLCRVRLGGAPAA